ncbi:MAG TPA: aldose 1-epimerase family protein [Acetobacteraceae bacterium]|jgi:galactose mutarotase-like enzyme|nr:aldose 1-epimerase family protein [Acetobacteraceae bacterium]
MQDRHVIQNGYLSAAIKADGAELYSLCDATGSEMLWQAEPIWPRHAPVLFPIVGRLKDDTLRHNGRTYTLGQHGFARDHRFAWLNRSATSCRLVLRDDGGSRAVYPFGFRFEVGFALEDDALVNSFTIVNTGRELLPASVGAHPGFRWPLSDEFEKAAHVLEFDQPEPAPIRRLSGGLLGDPQPTPIQGSTLALDPALFEADALILDQVASSSVRFTAPGAEVIEVSWEGFRELGVWMRPGGDFLCIEPWHGTASPVGFDGEFLDKPGLLLIPPGDKRVLTMRLRLC